MSTVPATQKQVPEHSILDRFNKQIYLGNQFQFALANTEILTTSEFPLLLLSNPSQSGSTPPALSLFQSVRRIIALTASQTAILRFYTAPTVTANGTAQSAVNLRTGSSIASIASLYLNPTISANGTFITAIASTAMVPSASDLMIIIDPLKSLLVTVQTSSATTFISAEFGWFEL